MHAERTGCDAGIHLGDHVRSRRALQHSRDEIERERPLGWRPSGSFTLGRIGFAWPRTPDPAWYDNYIVALGALVVVGLGAVYIWLRPRELICVG